MTTKVCSKCKEPKAFSEFCKDSGQKSGLYPSCKACAKIAKSTYLLKPEVREAGKARARKWMAENKERQKANRANWLALNKEKAKQTTRDWQKNNRERVNQTYKKYYERNRESVLERKLKAIALKPEKSAEKSALRRANTRNATPRWANMFFISEAYHLAALRGKMTGIKWHVDHVVPLKGEYVCGLHAENNLQVIPAVENIRKKNHFC